MEGIIRKLRRTKLGLVLLNHNLFEREDFFFSSRRRYEELESVWTSGLKIIKKHFMASRR